MLWFLRGETNIKPLVDANVHIWDEWADESGELGPVYGKQWRRWQGEMVLVDQIAGLVHDLRTNPFSRRLIVSAWNPPDVPKMKLPPCHTLFQCYVQEGCVNRLSLHLYTRSIDSFLGLPFNIASYALLLSMLAQVCRMVPGELIISFGDVHIYRNHFEQVKLQLSREPRQLPLLTLAPRTEIDGWQFTDFHLQEYDPHPAIKGEVSV